MNGTARPFLRNTSAGIQQRGVEVSWKTPRIYEALPGSSPTYTGSGRSDCDGSCGLPAGLDAGSRGDESNLLCIGVHLQARLDSSLAADSVQPEAGASDRRLSLSPLWAPDEGHGGQCALSPDLFCIGDIISVLVPDLQEVVLGGRSTAALQPSASDVPRSGPTAALPVVPSDAQAPYTRIAGDYGRFVSLAVSEGWPDSPLPVLWSIAGCESDYGRNPRAYDLDADSGGFTQIHKRTWQQWFLVNYSWTWEEIVLDDATNLRAALIIYLRAGDGVSRGSFGPWSCWKP